jgi:hypothetical protein
MCINSRDDIGYVDIHNIKNRINVILGKKISDLVKICEMHPLFVEHLSSLGVSSGNQPPGGHPNYSTHGHPNCSTLPGVTCCMNRGMLFA